MFCSTGHRDKNERVNIKTWQRLACVGTFPSPHYLFQSIQIIFFYYRKCRTMFNWRQVGKGVVHLSICQTLLTYYLLFALGVGGKVFREKKSLIRVYRRVQVVQVKAAQVLLECSL